MNVIAVIVTFNRLELLKKTINAYSTQTQTFDTIIIVDNNSTDGTSFFLSEWLKTETKYRKELISLSDNIGGAGGFYIGEKRAMELHADWIHVADDDAYPEKEYLEKFKSFLDCNEEFCNCSAICSNVLNMDDSISLTHRRNIKYRFGIVMTESYHSEEYYKSKYFNIDLFSYVGTFLNAQVLKKVGLVNPDLFIYADDSEHSLRCLRFAPIICVPSLIIHHEGGYQGQIDGKDILMTWRDYYYIRNMENMLWKHHKPAAFYYLFRSIYHYVRLYWHNWKCLKLLYIALSDGILNRLGRHTTYNPNYMIKKQVK